MNNYKAIIILILRLMFCNIKGEIDYQISMPEFICDENNPGSEIKKSTTTIGLEGEGKLNFRLTFKRMSNPCKNNQRCNLIVWKVIRDFENYLNNYNYEQTNSIEFNNSMLMPGLKYIFNVYVTQGETKEQKQFSMDFVDKKDTDAVKKPLASISLIGSSVAEAHMPYILNAKINICSNISNYYIEWKLLDESRNILETFPERGLELTIPSSTLQNGRQYFIKCSLIKMENDDSVTTNTKSVSVKNNMDSLTIKLPMIYTTMSTQQSINIKPYINDLANQEEDIKKHWSCIYKNNNVCDNKDEDTLNIEGGFLEEGDYNISLTVTKGSTVKTEYSIIKILRDVPSIEIDTVPTPVLPSSGVEIRANIEDLRTFCTLQWKSEEGPYFLDLNSVPGNVNELLDVVVKRDIFLKELEEFSNEVSNKEYNLIIPPPIGDWSGLPNKDEDYKIRFILEAKCPKALLQSNEVDIELSEDVLNDTLMVSALVEIEVNVPPKSQPLMVEPLTGIALETVFTFQTSEALETSTKRPFLYKFGYVMGDREFVFCSMIDYLRCETILPYIVDGVGTFLENCNSFGSCGKIFGPILNITLPEGINEKNILRIFKEKMNNEDFYKAFGYALTVLRTSKALGEDEKYMEMFSTEIFNKIEFLLKYYKADTNWAKRTNKLITYISDYNKELSFSDDVLNGLVELRTKLLNAEKQNFAFLQRKLLTININRSPDLDSIKSYIEVSDLIIANSKDKNRVEIEKEHLREKIKEYVGNFCKELYQMKRKVFLVFKSVILVVEELPKKSYGNFHVIPYSGNPWNATAEIKFRMENVTEMGDKKLCIAKTAYKDFFNKSGITYEAEILDSNDGSRISENIDAIVSIPFGLEESTEKTPKCLVYKNNWQTSCKLVKVITKYAQCSCSMIGSYYLEFEDKLPAVTVVPTAENNVTNSANIKPQLENIYTKNEEKTTTKSTIINPVDKTPEPRMEVDTHTDIIPILNSISTSRPTLEKNTTDVADFSDENTTSMDREKTHRSTSTESSIPQEDNTAVIVSYVLITCSLLGIGILYFVSKKMSKSSVHDVYMQALETPNYAKLYDEDSLS